MNLATVYTRANSGIEAPLVRVEVHISRGLPAFNIVGLPEKSVKESKDRVRSALLSNHFEFPYQRITVNLAPADLPKEGSRFDLPIAIGILIASKQLTCNDIEDYELAAELGLTGKLRKVTSIVPMALKCKQHNKKIIVAKGNAKEASLAQGEGYEANHLLGVTGHLSKKKSLKAIMPYVFSNAYHYDVDLKDIKGQQQAKRALMVAAAGWHNLLLFGPPGSGKTMLAERLTTILPPLSITQTQEMVAINSLSNSLGDEKKWQQVPLRSPHHTSSCAAVIGGGNPPQPGEISLAHRGVLFLDELPEFQRSVLEALREPLESKRICISRALRKVIYPADFLLVSAMNPCPCGYAGDKNQECRCSDEKIKRYQNKISGPLLDRIDCHVCVSRVNTNILNDDKPLSSQEALNKVIAARERQYTRQGKLNSQLLGAELIKPSWIAPKDKMFLNQTTEKLKLSIRAYYKLIKVSRTIADLDGSDRIERKHLCEAFCYRQVKVC